MDAAGIVPTMPVNGYGDGFGCGNSMIFLIAILAMLGGGFGGFGRNGQVATTDDLNFGRFESQVRANAELTERKTDNIINGLSTVGYTIAEKSGETNALIIAEAQKTRDMLQQNKIEALQGRINQLELQQALCGVVRYPTQTNFAVPSPIFNGCGWNGNYPNV